MMKTYRDLKITAIVTALIAMLFISADNNADSDKFINPGFRINTEGNDFSPSITADGNIMVFDSKKPEEKSHNIFICLKKNNVWGEPFPLFTKNTGYNDETPFISADGKIILFSSDRPGGVTPSLTADGRKRITFDIYISRYANERWSAPELLKGDVNTIMNERSPSLSRDGKYLFFARWPFNNIGRSKIYRASFDNGKYSDVTELPDNINSGSAEAGFIPSYKENGKYYFSSMRSGGFGGWDIYSTTVSGKGFTNPVNAGKGINGEFNEFYFSESANTKVICSDRFGGLGGYDIYVNSSTVKQQEEVSQVKVSSAKITRLRITASDYLSGKHLSGMLFKISLMSGDGSNEKHIRTTEAKSGNEGYFDIYPKNDISSLVIEPVSADYAGSSIKVKVIHDQYQSISIYLKKAVKEKIQISENEDHKTVKKDKDIPPVKKEPEKEQTITEETEQVNDAKFDSIFFDFGSSLIKTDSIPDLYTVLEYMRNNDSAVLHITGYADHVGSRKINNRISYARALRVKNFFVSMDIDPRRIKIRGAGESRKAGIRKVVKNSRFRRVDFRVTE